MTLERRISAARALGDAAAEASALHEMGARAVCLGETGAARATLSQALQLREALADQAAAAATRQNLNLVTPPAPVSDSATEHATTAHVPVMDLDSLPFRDEMQLPVGAPKKHRLGTALFFVLLLASVGGFVHSVPDAVLWLRSVNVPSLVSRLENRLETLFDSQVSTPPSPFRAAIEPPLEQPRDATVVSLDAESPRIRIFTARPGSMTTGGPTNLCYAVNGASQARVEPDIGEVAPTDRLTCLRVTPARTTTYELIAHGGDGNQVTQQLVIVVR